MSARPADNRPKARPQPGLPKAVAQRKKSAAFTLSWDGRVLGSPGSEPEALSPAEFRRLVAEKVLEELSITWKPRVVGGTKHEPITGLAPAFLPRGVELELLSLSKRDSGIFARYRVRRQR